MFAFLTKHQPLSILLPILILGAGLRGYGLLEKGIFDYDEAWYLLEAKTLYYTVPFTLGKLGITSDPDVALGLKAYIKQRGTVPMTSIKPGLTLLYVIGFLIFGPHDYAGFLISTLAGLLTIYLVYAIGKDAYHRHVGYFAALILAVSPFHILYSRSTYAQACGILFVTLGAYLWHRSHLRPQQTIRSLVLAGLSVGWAFTCHFNLAWITVAFMAVEAFVLWTKKTPLKPFSMRLCILGMMMATPALFFEIAGQLAKTLGIFPADYPTYLGQFAHRQSLAQGAYFSMEQVPFWTSRLLQLEGVLVVLAAFIGFMFIAKHIRQIRPADALILGLFLAVVVPPSLIHSKGLYYILRNYAAIMPSVALLAGAGSVWMLSHLHKRMCSLATIACVLAFITNGVWGVRDLLPLRSGYRDAVHALMQHIKTHGGQLSTQPPSAWPIWYFYLSEAYDQASPDLRRHIRFYPGDNDHSTFELLDIKRYYRGVYAHEPDNLSAYTRLRQTAHPIVVVNNPVASLPRKYFEADGPVQVYTLNNLHSLYPQIWQIEIFDLTQVPSEILSLSPFRGEASHE